MKTWMRALWGLTAVIVLLIAMGAGAAQALGGPAGGGQQMTLMKAEVDKANVAPGGEVTFLFQIKSTGTRELDGPRLIYHAPAGVTVVSATSSRGKIINVGESLADVDVVNLLYNDTVDIVIVARVKPDVAVGSAIVNDFTISSAYVGAQEAHLGIKVIAAGAKPATIAGLPKAGAGLALLLVGVVLAAVTLTLRALRSRRSAG